MEDLDHATIAHQLPERCEVDAVGEGIDDRLDVRARELDEAQLGPERLLAHDLGVDGNVGAVCKLAAEDGKSVSRSDDIHRGLFGTGMGWNRSRSGIAGSPPAVDHFLDAGVNIWREKR